MYVIVYSRVCDVIVSDWGLFGTSDVTARNRGIAWLEERSLIRPCEVETFTMSKEGESSLYPIAVLIDELRNDDVQVGEHEKRVMSV